MFSSVMSPAAFWAHSQWIITRKSKSAMAARYIMRQRRRQWLHSNQHCPLTGHFQREEVTFLHLTANSWHWIMAEPTSGLWIMSPTVKHCPGWAICICNGQPQIHQKCDYDLHRYLHSQSGLRFCIFWISALPVLQCNRFYNRPHPLSESLVVVAPLQNLIQQFLQRQDKHTKHLEHIYRTHTPFRFPAPAPGPAGASLSYLPEQHCGWGSCVCVCAPTLSAARLNGGTPL